MSPRVAHSAVRTVVMSHCTLVNQISALGSASAATANCGDGRVR